MYFLSINSIRIKAIFIFIIKKYKNYPNIKYKVLHKTFYAIKKSPVLPGDFSATTVCKAYLFSAATEAASFFHVVAIQPIAMTHAIMQEKYTPFQPKLLLMYAAPVLESMAPK